MNGSSVKTFFAAENGAKVVENTLSAGQGTFFPKGSLHFQQNLACETVQLVASLNNEDGGTLFTAPAFFSMPADVIGAALNLDANQVNATAAGIPPAFLKGSQDCIATCGL